VLGDFVEIYHDPTIVLQLFIFFQKRLNIP
jgi:hypothetical protein